MVLQLRKKYLEAISVSSASLSLSNIVSFYYNYTKENADKIRQQQKEYIKQYQKQYNNQQCLYEDELLSLNALRIRFSKKGIEHPTQEAKKYLIKLP